jgi:hypothetical protein
MFNNREIKRAGPAMKRWNTFGKPFQHGSYNFLPIIHPFMKQLLRLYVTVNTIHVLEETWTFSSGFISRISAIHIYRCL